MRNLFKTILLLVLLVLPRAAQAEWDALARFAVTDAIRKAALRPEIDLESRTATEFAMLDHPNLHLPWLRKMAKELKPETQPVQWVRVCWALATVDAVTDQDLLVGILPRCIQVANEQKLHVEWVDLSYNQINYRRSENDLEAYSKDMDALVNEVRTFHDPDALALALALHAIDLMRYRILDRSLPLISEANELLENRSQVSINAFVMSRNATGNSLRYRELHKEAISLDRDLIRIYRDLGARMLTARIQYSVGFSLLFQEKPEYEESYTALISALQMAQDIGYRSLVGSCSSLLALHLSRRGQHKEAIAKASQAMEIFKSEEEGISLAYAEKRLAEVLVAAAAYAEAQKVLDRASKELDQHNLEFRKDLRWLRYQTALGLHDRDRALGELEAYTKLVEELGRQRAEDEYNRAAASLGLQLAQQRSEALEQENRLQTQKLAEAERIRTLLIIMALLAVSTFGFLILSLFQIKRVKASRAQMKSILENIDEALLTVDVEQKIGQDFSLHLRQLVGQDRPIAGQDFVDTVIDSPALPLEQKAIIREVLHATLHESRLAWELNVENLPQELRLGTHADRIYALRWIPIFNEADELRQLLVSLTDITKARSLERELGAREQKLRTLPDKLRELLAIKQEHRQDILIRTERTLAALSANGGIPEILRDLHTEKGLARTLGLKELSQHIHQLETSLMESDGKTPWEETVGRLHELLQEYHAFASVLQEASSGPGGNSPWLGQILDVNLASWQKQLADARLSLAELRVWDSVLTWNPRDFELARDVCLHAITNSFDHGFIFPRQRGKSVSPPVITVQAQVKDQALHLDIHDNGHGLDLERIQSLARDKGFVPGAEETFVDVIFIDGTSSADQVTLSSGRGIGLSAVKKMIEARGGRVQLKNHAEGPGTHLHAEWPLSGILSAVAHNPHS